MSSPAARQNSRNTRMRLPLPARRLRDGGVVRRRIFKQATAGLSVMLLCLILFRAAVARAQEVDTAQVRVLNGWQLAADVEQSWESNVPFEHPTDPGDRATRVRLGLARFFQTPRWNLSLEASGATLRYGELTSLSRQLYDVTVRGTRDLTRRAGGWFEYRGQSALTNRGFIPGGGGPFLARLIPRRIHSGKGMLTYRNSTVTTSYLKASFTDLSFGDAGPVGGWIASAGAEVRHRQSRVATL